MVVGRLAPSVAPGQGHLSATPCCADTWLPFRGNSVMGGGKATRATEGTRGLQATPLSFPMRNDWREAADFSI